MGRPNKYETHVDPKLNLIEGWSRNGLTLDQIAKNLGIAPSTLKDYKNKFSDLSDALKKGREVADIEVEGSLFKRANGYEFEEVTRELINVIGDDGKPHKKLMVTKVVTKQVAPDVTAQIFWLKNRKPDDWRDRRDQTTSEFDKGNLDKLTSVLEQGVKKIRGDS